MGMFYYEKRNALSYSKSSEIMHWSVPWVPSFFLDVDAHFCPPIGCQADDTFLVRLWKLSLWWWHVPWEPATQAPKTRKCFLWSACISLCGHDPPSFLLTFPLSFVPYLEKTVVIANEKIITPKWQFTVALPEKSNLVFTFFFFSWIPHWCKNKKLEEWLPNSAKRKKEIESDTWKSFPSSDSKMRALIFTYFHAYWSSKGYSEVFLIHNRKLCHFNWPIIS